MPKYHRFNISSVSQHRNVDNKIRNISVFFKISGKSYFIVKKSQKKQEKKSQETKYRRKIELIIELEILKNSANFWLIIRSPDRETCL